MYYVNSMDDSLTGQRQMVKFLNKKHISPETLSHMTSLAEFVLNKFFNKNKKDKLDIIVRFKKGMFAKSGEYGNCVWEDCHYRPNDFTIEMDPDQPLKLLLNTLAHELVHVKQWAKGEMYELQRERAVYKFNGERIDLNNIDYWDMPWEIEAHGRAIGLVVQWVRSNKLEGREMVLEEV